MNSYIQQITLDTAGNSVPVYKYMKQGDGDATYVNVTVTANGVKLIPQDGDIASIRVIKPDSTVVINSAVIEDDGTITARITKQMTAVCGIARADISIIGIEQEVMSTVTFFLDIDAFQVADGITSSNEYLLLLEMVTDGRTMLNDYGSALEQLDAIREDIATLRDDALQFSETAGDAMLTAAESASTAAAAAQGAAASAKEAATSEVNAATSAAAAGKSAEAAASSESAAAESAESAAEDAESAASDANASEAWAVGTMDGEPVPENAPQHNNNAKYYAEQAKDIEERVGHDAEIIENNADAIQAVQNNIQAIIAAPESAETAAQSAEQAGKDADRAENAADRAQSIAQGAKGYYPTEDALNEAYPSGANGDWAIVGSTDTIWIWDSDTGKWSDSGNKTDLSEYYTKIQTDELISAVEAPTFTEAEERSNISSGEKLSTLFGKIRKWFAGLADVAFSGEYSDLTGTPDIPTDVLPLAGGTMTGQIKKAGLGGSWINGRLYALVRTISCLSSTSFFPIASMKTLNGSWEIGTIGEDLAFSYATDSNFDAGTNTTVNKKIDTSGNYNGNAATATKLATARTIRTNLASTATASFDGSANVTPGVTGVLSAANGGTGRTTGAAQVWTKLWTNAAPATTFAPQTITISTLANYNLFMIVYAHNGTVGAMVRMAYIPGTGSAEIVLDAAMTAADLDAYNRRRNATIDKSAKTITFSEGWEYRHETTNKACNPLYVFGTNI